MHTRRAFGIAGTLVALAVLTGCATMRGRVQAESVQAIEGDLRNDTTVVVNVTATAAEAESERTGLTGWTLLRLRELELFKRVEADSAAQATAGTLVLNVNILSINKVSSTTR